MIPSLATVIDEWKAKCATMPGRAVPEWKGKTPDTKIPKAVRLRVFRTWDGIDYLTGIKIVGKEWEVEHVIALVEGGEHREGNMRPVLKGSQKDKTAAEIGRKSKADRQGAHHAGLAKSKTPMKSRKFTPAEPQRKASRPIEKFSSLGLPAIARQYVTKDDDK